MKFGTLYAYWTTEWTGDFCALAHKCKDAGFDVIEVGAGNLLSMSDGELAELHNTCKQLNLKISANLGPPKDAYVASADEKIRRAGVKFLCDICDKMAKIDCHILIGALYTCWPYDFSDLDKEAMWKRAADGLREVGEYAQKYDITLALEVLNRFESNLLNTCEEGVRFCEDVNLPNVKLLLDTFHMNIEEDNIVEAFRKSKGYLAHVHVGEANRKLPGMGSLDWKAIGDVLNEIGFDGFVVMEPFMRNKGTVGTDIKVWRDLSDGADEAKMDEYIAESVRFLRSAFAKKA